MFWRLRAGMDVAYIQKHMKDGNLLIRLSLQPETFRPFKFLLLAKFSQPHLHPGQSVSEFPAS